MTTKKSESESKSDTSAEDAPQADPEAAPGGAPDVDAIKQASGEAVQGESGSQEGWRERHGADGGGEAEPPA
jgi:hypothetical protein